MTEEEIRLACIHEATKMVMSLEPVVDRVRPFIEYVGDSEMRLGCLREAMVTHSRSKETKRIVSLAREYEKIVFPEPPEKPGRVFITEAPKKRGRRKTKI